MQTKKRKTHAGKTLKDVRKRLRRNKKQEVNDTETFTCVQMKKMKTHAGRGFGERIMEK